ncbi:hypothetical protein FA13DRAFT_1729263 [Coprinellus micaceus]|uniref:Uncharacterized protein n=1 Tax=Coprinellus micaceus TaxID=71717 RepID=A0A4Y7TKB7_COPMI|nr:hypothetical protein FA13DRAFT_1729263 [Coprinellus micaceus]
MEYTQGRVIRWNRKALDNSRSRGEHRTPGLMKALNSWPSPLITLVVESRKGEIVDWVFT